METRLISLYRNNQEDQTAACLRHDDNYAEPTAAALPFGCPIVSFISLPLPCFLLITLCLSSGCLTPISISHCHTLHHSALYLPSLLPLLSEALQTSRCSIQRALYSHGCLRVCRQPSSQLAEPLSTQEGKNVNSSDTQRSLCSSYIVNTRVSLCTGYHCRPIIAVA